MISSAPRDAIAAMRPASLPAERVVYLYAFIDPNRSGDLLRPPDMNRPLSVHRAGATSAVIGWVPVTEFCGVEGERNLADPAWIMPRIRVHEAVVESAMERSPVFPARFATLYGSLDRLTDSMLRHATAITSFLRQVTDRQEWALKITVALDESTALDDLAAELWPEWSGYPPGKRYLRLRQERAALLKVAGERAALLTPGIVDGLRPLTTAIRPMTRSVAEQGAGQQYVESYALLASVAHRAALHDRLRELSAQRENQRIRCGLSGPWPPYSFRPSLEESGPPQDQQAT
jgi:hypothetical protein